MIFELRIVGPYLLLEALIPSLFVEIISPFAGTIAQLAMIEFVHANSR